MDERMVVTREGQAEELEKRFSVEIFPDLIYYFPDNGEIAFITGPTTLTVAGLKQKDNGMFTIEELNTADEFEHNPNVAFILEGIEDDDRHAMLIDIMKYVESERKEAAKDKKKK